MKQLQSLSAFLFVLAVALSPNCVMAAAAPVITSAPTISGVPVVGNTITICVTATDPQGLPLSFTYNYGAGMSDTLGKHVYSAAGVYPVTVTISNGLASSTAALSVTIKEVSNLWIMRQTIKTSPAGKQFWEAEYLYNADRTMARIFNPASESFGASLGTIPPILIPGTAMGQRFSGTTSRLLFKSAKGVKPAVSVTIDESSQIITINATLETFSDKVPGVFHNTVNLGASNFFVDEALDAKGRFTANSGFRSTAFVVTDASIKVVKPGKDMAMFSLLLGDPAFAFPSVSSAKTVRVRVTNVLNKIVLDKDFTQFVTYKRGRLTSGKDITTPAGSFSYDSTKGEMNFRLLKATLGDSLTTSEEHVRVDVTIGDQTYSTHVTLFAAKAGTYSTRLPAKFTNFIPGKIPDITAPTVTSTVPANSGKGVAFNRGITATFSKPMNPATINNTVFTLRQGNAVIPGTVGYAGNTATFTPANALPPSATFIATITTGATDLSGNTLTCNYVWSFSTGASADTTPPTVVSTFPSNSATGVAINTKISAAFSEAMNPLTLNTTTFTLMQGTTALSGTVAYAANNATVTFVPSSNLTPNTTFTATLTTGAQDLAGNALVANVVWTFTTAATMDTTPPTVVATLPGNSSSGVAINAQMSATFSEAMDPLTLNTATFTLMQGSTSVAGTVAYNANGAVATFTPSSNLIPSTMYTATITTGATDLAGNALTANVVWTFITSASSDTTPPTVISNMPANSATGIAINSKVIATFSEAMDPLTITSGSFTLMQGSAAVMGSVTYTANGSAATITPSGNLTPNTLYTATVTTGAKDVAGNALTTNVVWSFTTAVSADTTPPTVLSTLPAASTTGVAVNTKISATFSEAMDPMTINTSTVIVMQGNTVISGVVTFNGAAATFTPSNNLAPNTTFTATVTTGAKDLAGNALAVNFVWSFTTGAAADITPPNVLSTNPIDQATGVAVNHSVNATFDKAMDPSTLNTVTFTLVGPGPDLNPITGTVAYDTASKIITFVPGSDLSPNTQFTATVTTGARDLAGNALAVNKVWVFTTGTQKAIVPAPLGQVSTFGTFGGGAGMTNEGILTVVNGDISTSGASTTVTGFHDSTGDIYTETPLNKGQVNGRIYTAPPTPGGAGVGGNATTFAIASQGTSDANAAYNKLSPASTPGGIDPGAGQLGGLTLFPGVYKAAGGTFQITGSDLTLDAQGDANATWIFQMAASLTVGAPAAPRSVILINGAKAKNVFWQVGSAATINAAGGGTMVGTIIASSGITFSTSGNVTLVTLNGRAIGLNASTTLVNTIINVPAP